MDSHVESVGSGSSSASAFSAKWSKKTVLVAGVGAVLAVIGAAVAGKDGGFAKQFGYSYLLAFMFFLSLCLGGLFLTVIHHLFDASWSVPVRRLTEHLACLAPVLFLLFIPIMVLAKSIYPWMSLDPANDHALMAKQPLFTMGGWYGISILLFVIWTILSFRLRGSSVAQDSNGAAIYTLRNRVNAAWGIIAFAFTLTMGAILWMKSLEHQWFSTMYGVYYFAGSVWTTLATLYVLALILKRAGPLALVAQRRQFHDIAVLFYAFTVFYAYIHFSQYFIIWNGGMPEETFYYVQRESGSWWGICMLIVFGHFLVPFLAMARIDAKLNPAIAVPVCLWAWVMHYCDMSFNVMPILRPKNFELTLADIGCWLFIGGVLATVWLKSLAKYPAYPLKDPRLGEALGIHFHDDSEHDHPAAKAVK